MAKQEKKEEQIKFEAGVPQKRIEEYNNTFFSTETSFHFDGRYITLDFKRLSPRFDGTIVVEHCPVMVDIFHAKDFAQKFSGLIGMLEKQFGNVESPEFIKKFVELAQEEIKKAVTSSQNEIEGVAVTSKEINYFG